MQICCCGTLGERSFTASHGQLYLGPAVAGHSWVPYSRSLHGILPIIGRTWGKILLSGIQTMLICINKLSFCQRFLNKIKPAHHKFLIEIIYGITWKIQIMHTGSSLLVLNSALFIIPPFYLCTGRWFLEKYKFPSSGCSCSDWTSSISREITSTHTCKIRKTSSFIARFKIGSIREKSNCYNIQLYEQRKTQPENPGCILFRDACVRQRTLLASPSRNHRINTWDSLWLR